ncbi:MAG TPA: hypothetical protein VIX85_12540 [Acidimicrobiales bacterium]
MALKTGVRLKSAVCDAEVIMVRAPRGYVDLRCGGHPLIEMTASGVPGMPISQGHGEGSILGKRYTNDETGVEVLCVKGGSGSLSVGDVPLAVKGAKPLPSSD